MEDLIENITRHTELSEKDKEILLKTFVHKAVRKKDSPIRNGEPCNKILFVRSGLLRAYFLDQNSTERNIMFALQDWWITDIGAFMNREKADLSVEALEDSALLVLYRDDLDRLFGEIPGFEKFFRIIMQNAYIREQRRVMYNLSYSAEKRYRIFENKYPQFVKRVPQKHIASYLGITPEFFSVVKKNVYLSSKS